MKINLLIKVCYHQVGFDSNVTITKGLTIIKADIQTPVLLRNKWKPVAASGKQEKAFISQASSAGGVYSAVM